MVGSLTIGFVMVQLAVVLCGVVFLTECRASVVEMIRKRLFQLSLFNFYQFHKILELRWFRTACLLRPNWWFVPMLKWWFVLLDLREDKLHCTVPRSGSLVKSMCNYFGVYIYSINNIYGLQEAKYRILNFWSCLYGYAWSASNLWPGDSVRTLVLTS